MLDRSSERPQYVGLSPSGNSSPRSCMKVTFGSRNGDTDRGDGKEDEETEDKEEEGLLPHPSRKRRRIASTSSLDSGTSPFVSRGKDEGKEEEEDEEVAQYRGTHSQSSRSRRIVSISSRESESEVDSEGSSVLSSLLSDVPSDAGYMSCDGPKDRMEGTREIGGGDVDLRMKEDDSDNDDHNSDPDADDDEYKDEEDTEETDSEDDENNPILDRQHTHDHKGNIDNSRKGSSRIARPGNKQETAVYFTPTPTPTPPRPPTSSTPEKVWERGLPLRIDDLEAHLSDSLMFMNMSATPPLSRYDDDDLPHARIRRGFAPITRAYGIPAERFTNLPPTAEMQGIAFPHLSIQLVALPGIIIPPRLKSPPRTRKKSTSRKKQSKPVPQWTTPRIQSRHAVSAKHNATIMRGQLGRIAVVHSTAAKLARDHDEHVWGMPSHLKDVYAITASNDTLKIIKMRREGHDEVRYTTDTVAEEPATIEGVKDIADYVERNLISPQVVAQRVKYVDHWVEVTRRLRSSPEAVVKRLSPVSETSG